VPFLKRATVEIDRDLLESLLSMATVIEARDAYTGGHTWRVSRYGEELAKRIGLDADGIFIVRVGGLVHDIGKVGIPDQVLNKQGPLTPDEYANMKLHPDLGRQILARHPLAPVVLPSVTEHHERVDGKGYPAGSPASVYGKLTAIADSFDAMTSTRPYRKGMEASRAIAILRENTPAQFDPAYVEPFVELWEKGALDHILGHANDQRLMLSCPSCGPIIAPPEDAKSGDEIHCPSCKGSFGLDALGDTFHIHFKRSLETKPTLMPDKCAVKSVLSCAKKKVHCMH